MIDAICGVFTLSANGVTGIVDGVHYEFALRWRHNDHAGVSNHQPHGCLLNRLFRGKSKKTSKLRVTGLCAGNSPGTGEFPAQMASYAENVSIWWRHHGKPCTPYAFTHRRSACRLTKDSDSIRITPKRRDVVLHPSQTRYLVPQAIVPAGSRITWNGINLLYVMLKNK